MAAMLAAGSGDGNIWDDTTVANENVSTLQPENAETEREASVTDAGEAPSVTGFSIEGQGESTDTTAQISSIPASCTDSTVATNVVAIHVGGSKTGAGSSNNSSDGPTPAASPAAGIPSTCHACSEPRVSRTITCQGCHKTFHWSCIGFYEHKYQKPWVNWRCKACRGTESLPGDPAASPRALVSADTTGQEAMTTLPVPTAVGSIGGERICPVCNKDIGRKRTIDCSICHTPSHASCVNVRGAETPKQWVCRQCQARAQGEKGALRDGGAEVDSAHGSRNASGTEAVTGSTSVSVVASPSVPIETTVSSWMITHCSNL